MGKVATLESVYLTDDLSARQCKPKCKPSSGIAPLSAIQGFPASPALGFASKYRGLVVDEHHCIHCGRRRRLEMDFASGRTGLDCNRPHRQLCHSDSRRYGYLRHTADSPSSHLVGYLRADRDGGCCAWRIRHLSSRQERRQRKLGEKDRQVAGPKSLSAVRKTRFLHSDAGRDNSSPVSNGACSHGRRRSAVLASKVSDSLEHWAWDSLPDSRLSGASVRNRHRGMAWPLLPPFLVCPDRSGCGGGGGGLCLLQVVPGEASACRRSAMISLHMQAYFTLVI